MPASDIILQRLHNQKLSHSEVRNPAKLVEWLLAVQGQDYAGAKWALGMRLPGSTDTDVEKAIASGNILRTWALRGTLHFVAPTDIHWLLDLLAARLIEKNARRYRQLELDEKTLRRSNDALEKTLSDGQPRTRKQLMALLEEKGISTRGQRAPYMLQRASLNGLIVQGVAPRNDPLYRPLDQPKANRLEKDEALAQLALRYFTSRGPATLVDFVWWSGLVTADARAGLEAVKSKLVEDTINGQSCWRAESGATDKSGSASAYLLPAYDEYIFAYKNREAILDQLAAQQVKRANGFSPVLVVNGRVAGVWSRALKKSSVSVDVNLFHKLKPAEKAALEAAARRYAEFLNLDLEMI